MNEIQCNIRIILEILSSSSCKLRGVVFFNNNNNHNCSSLQQKQLYIKVLFIVLSLAAALLLPINRIIEVKVWTYLPGLCDPARRGNRLSLSINHSIHQGIDHQF